MGLSRVLFWGCSTCPEIFRTISTLTNHFFSVAGKNLLLYANFKITYFAKHKFKVCNLCHAISHLWNLYFQWNATGTNIEVKTLGISLSSTFIAPSTAPIQHPLPCSTRMNDIIFWTQHLEVNAALHSSMYNRKSFTLPSIPNNWLLIPFSSFYNTASNCSQIHFVLLHNFLSISVVFEEAGLNFILPAGGELTLRPCRAYP